MTGFAGYTVFFDGIKIGVGGHVGPEVRVTTQIAAVFVQGIAQGVRHLVRQLVLRLGYQNRVGIVVNVILVPKLGFAKRHEIVFHGDRITGMAQNAVAIADE